VWRKTWGVTRFNLNVELVEAAVAACLQTIRSTASLLSGLPRMVAVA